MEIKHEIVKALQDETHAEMNLCKKALKYFKGDYNLAKTSIERHRWSMPLSGVVYHEPNEEDIEFIDKIRFKEFDDFFWDLRYSRRIEVKLNKDGITSTSALPSGNIVKVTNTDIAGGYNIADKSAFETDGSLIVYSKIAEGSLDNIREVMIAWSEAGEFTRYTFDLSRCTLANA